MRNEDFREGMKQLERDARSVATTYLGRSEAVDAEVFWNGIYLDLVNMMTRIDALRDEAKTRYQAARKRKGK